MKYLSLGVLMFGLVLGPLACQPGGEKLDKVVQQQGEILNKLRTLEANQKRLLAAPRAAAARPQRPQEDPNKVYKITLGSSPIRGNDKAPVSIVEWSDFQCPYCGRAAPVLEEVLKKYDGKVNLVYKHFPLSFHQSARPAALASMAAKDQGKFWEMHDVIFKNQRSLQPDGMVELAKLVQGIDLERFKKDLASKKDAYNKAIDADFRQGQAVTVRGTPTLFIAGKKVQNRSVAGMSAMIDTALKAADKKQGS